MSEKSLEFNFCLVFAKGISLNDDYLLFPLNFQLFLFRWANPEAESFSISIVYNLIQICVCYLIKAAHQPSLIHDL